MSGSAEKAIVEALNSVGLTGSLTGTYPALDGSVTYYWQGDGPNRGLALLLFALLGVDVTVTATGDGLAVTVPGDLALRVREVPALPEPEPAQAVTLPYELWRRFDLTGVKRVPALLFEQISLALEAGHCRRAKALARLTLGVALQTCDREAEAAARFALGLAAGDRGQIESAELVYRLGLNLTDSFNGAVCCYALALTSDDLGEALAWLQRARDILAKRLACRGLWYHHNRAGFDALAGEIDRAIGGRVPVMYVAARDN